MSSKYGITIYGSDTYGEVFATGFVAFGFAAISTNYGEVTVSWREPAGTYNRQILLFNPSGPPLHEADGQVLFDHVSTDANYHDIRYVHANLSQGRFFNYALFVYDSTGQVWRRAGVDEVLTTKNYGYTRRLYNGTPEVYKSTDFQALGNSSYTDEESFLYRFLSIIGFQLDSTRTEIETLRVTVDPRRVSDVVLPALGAQFGVAFEPQISGTSMRRLIAAATRLYAIKGTAHGLRVLADVVTGWPSAVTAGKNLALDNLDAGPVGAPGRWTGTMAGASVSFHAPDASYAGAFGSGVLDLSFDVAGPLGGLTTSRSTGLDRVRTAIPIQAGTTYTMSQYLQDPTGLTNARVVMVWLDGQGTELSRALGTYSLLANSLVRPATTAIAPTGAQYLEPVLEIVNRAGGNVTQGTHVFASGFQVEAAVAATSWEPARQTHLRMTVNRPIDIPVKSHRLALLLEDFMVPGSSVALEFVQLTGTVVGGVSLGGSALPTPPAASSAGSIMLGSGGSAITAAVMGTAVGGVTLGGSTVTAPAAGTVVGGVTLDGSALPSPSAASSTGFITLGAGSVLETAIGGVDLGGTAAAIQPSPASSTGTISFSGTAATSPATATASGSLVLGGSGIARAGAAGTLTLSGTGTTSAIAATAGSVALGGTAATGATTVTMFTGQLGVAANYFEIGLAPTVVVSPGAATATGGVTLGGSATSSSAGAGSAGLVILNGNATATVIATTAGSVGVTLGGPVATGAAGGTAAGTVTLSGTETTTATAATTGLISLGGTAAGATNLAATTFTGQLGVAASYLEPGLAPTVVPGAAGASDTFTRANSATSLGTATSGQTWVASVGTWGITSNTAYIPTPVANASNIAYIAAIKSDGTFQVTVADSAGVNDNAALVLRYVDASNYLNLTLDGFSGAVLLQKVVAGTATTVATAAATFPTTASQVLTVVASGSSYVCKLNGTTVFSATDTALNTATGVGLAAYNGAGRTATNVRFSALSVT